MKSEQDLKHKLEEQTKIINFLKTKYMQDTGAEWDRRALRHMLQILSDREL